MIWVKMMNNNRLVTKITPNRYKSAVGGFQWILYHEFVQFTSIDNAVFMRIVELFELFELTRKGSTMVVSNRIVTRLFQNQVTFFDRSSD